MSADYYNILGLERGASAEEVKKAYRKLAMQHHPDRGGDPEEFKKINEAYSVLGDEQKKYQYDTFGTAGDSPFGGGFSGGVDVDLGDIFSQFFGGGYRSSQRRSGVMPGEDIQEVIAIDLKTSLFGGTYTLHYHKHITCPECEGAGGSGKKSCPDCGGTGTKRQRQQTVFGTVEHTTTCPTCRGTGESFESVCQKCHGQKRVSEKVSLEVEIPAGIDDGMVIRINGEGSAGIGAPAGDLYVKFQVNLSEKNLTRRGTDLYYDMEVDVIEAVLGATKEINIPILGKRTVEIKPATQMGTVIKMAGDGVKFIDRDRKGDLYINLDIKIPKKLTDTERACFEKIAKERDLEVKTKKGLLEKIFG